jgi:hypothetical protein
MKKVHLLILLAFIQIELSAQKESTLFRTPLSFYNTDILGYLQVLHKNMLYEQMSAFFVGSLRENKSKTEFSNMIAEAPFGYSLKRSGIRETKKGESWSLTYQRTIEGTQETFKIDCVLINDTCRVILNEQSYKSIFRDI